MKIEIKIKLLNFSCVLISLGLYITLNPKDISEIIGASMMSIGLSLMMIELNYKLINKYMR